MKFFFSVDKSLTHLKRLAPKHRYPKSTNLILVQAWMMPSVALGLHLFVPFLAKFHDAIPVSYYGTYGGVFKSLKENVRNFFSFYRWVGINRFLLFDFSKMQNTYYEMARNLIKENQDAFLFEKIHYKGVLIGDLVGDSFIRGANRPTVEFEHPMLLQKLAESLFFVDKLIDFYSTNPVKAVVIIESLYTLAIPARVAISLGISAYVITQGAFFRLGRTENAAFRQWRFHETLFANLPTDIQAYGIKIGEKLLQAGLEQGKLPTNRVLKNFPFVENEQYCLRQPMRLLVATHDFFDSPHKSGYSFYPDFYVWLQFIRFVALNRDYQIFIKPHPHARKWNREVLDSMFEGIRNVTLLDSKMPMGSVLDLEISAALTVYGTIGAELPLFGIPVINASSRHLHENIPGNVTPKSREEYESIILNLASMQFTEYNSFQNILRYYFMRYRFDLKSFIGPNLEEASKALGLDPYWTTRRGFNWPLALDLVKGNPYNREVISKGVEQFLKSDDYFLNRFHLDKFRNIEDFEEYK